MCKVAVALSLYYENMPLKLYWMKRISPVTLLSQTVNAIIHSTVQSSPDGYCRAIIHLLLIIK